MGKPRKLLEDSVAGAAAGWKVQGILGEIVLDRSGDFKRALQVLSYVAAWGLFFDTNDRPPETDREFSAGVKVPLGTAHRWRTAFAQTFPELESPLPLWLQVKAGVRSDAIEVVAMEVGASEVNVAS